MIKRTLVTSALPYANGPLHFGHLAGVYLPADIYVRHLRLKKVKVIHISGSDEHGVAIMQNAQKANITYKEYVDSWHEKHKKLFADYMIDFDFFGQTSSDYHREETLKWFKVMNDKGAFEQRDEPQLQCQDCHNFLPDRYVEGECYVCKYPKARGDECPQCGTWIDALKLTNTLCKFCGSKNIEVKTSKQWYLTLSKYSKVFNEWFKDKTFWKKTVYPYVQSLVHEGLVDRAMTRDLDWGIDVPLVEAKGKKFYVWFDAPIGYVSNTKKYLEEKGIQEDYLKDWWQSTETKIVNFVGKDNVIFHSIIFPMMSLISGFARPVDELPANQFVNLYGKQFSKSQEWYVDAEDAYKQFGVDALRYQLTTLIPETADTSFTFEGFDARVNNELANNLGNLVSRCLKFWEKNWPVLELKGELNDELSNDNIMGQDFISFWETQDSQELMDICKNYHETLEHFEFRRSLELLMQLSAKANLFFSDSAPWAQIKADKNLAKKTIAHTVNWLMVLGVYFSPFMPKLAEELSGYFSDFLSKEWKEKIYLQDWDAWKKYLKSLSVVKLMGPIGMLVPKIDAKMLKDLDQEFIGKLKG